MFSSVGVWDSVLPLERVLVTSLPSLVPLLRVLDRLSDRLLV